MNIAIMGADTILRQALQPALQQAGHDVHIASIDVLDEDGVRHACQGIDRIVLLPGEPRRDTGAAEDGRLLDTALKGTWNVLLAARDAGVRQVVQISDVCIYSGYEDNHILSEDMVTLPDTTAEQQALHLAEGVAHEFGRDTPGLVLTIRLGRLVRAAELAADAPFDRDWLDVDDAAAAIVRGLELDAYDHPAHWGLYNLVADTPQRRFSQRITGGKFAFSAAEDFSAWWPKGVPQ